VDGLSPLVLTVTDCFECADLPAIGRPACAFESGILAAVFSGYFGGEPDIRETACYAMGDWCCRFVIGNRERRTEPGLRNTGTCGPEILTRGGALSAFSNRTKRPAGELRYRRR
jgi:hypothetical protein